MQSTVSLATIFFWLLISYYTTNYRVFVYSFWGSNLEESQQLPNLPWSRRRHVFDKKKSLRTEQQKRCIENKHVDRMIDIHFKILHTPFFSNHGSFWWLDDFSQFLCSKSVCCPPKTVWRCFFCDDTRWLWSRLLSRWSQRLGSDGGGWIPGRFIRFPLVDWLHGLMTEAGEILGSLAFGLGMLTWRCLKYLKT